MAEIVKRGNSLKKELNKKIRDDNRLFLTNIGFLVVSVVLSFQLKNILFFIAWVVYRKVIDKKWKKAMAAVSIARAGMRGERLTEESLHALPKDYKLFADITIEYDKKESQIDHIVVGPTGVYVVETKYWTGDIVEGNSDNTVIQVKKGKNIEHYHPSKQVGTHVYRLSSVLKKEGVRAWVRGCAHFSNEDVQVFIENEKNPLFDRAGALLSFIKEEKQNEPKLTQDEIQNIVKIIKKNVK